MANVLEVLQAAGLDVEAEPGWETRRGSRYSFDHRPGGTLGMIVHHTAAGGSADMPCRRICTFGRSDLKGPLVQFLLGRSGKLLLISQNRCNHAGRGSSESHTEPPTMPPHPPPVTTSAHAAISTCLTY